MMDNILVEAARLLGRMQALEKVQEKEEILPAEQIDTIRKRCIRLLNEKIDIPLFHAEQMDARVLETYAFELIYLEKIEEDCLPVGELIVVDDGNQVRQIAKCNRVKALQGKLRINDTIRRTSNFPEQTNHDRLTECLEWIKNHGYPFLDNYILLFGSEYTIMDGWHRAACLYYLNGNIKVPVRRVFFQKGVRKTAQYIFPYEKVKKGSKVAIYGAGDIGRTYVEQLKENKYCSVVGWTDSKWERMRGEKLISLEAVVKLPLDYVVIAVRADEAKAEMENSLLRLGFPKEKIVQRCTWE